MQRIQKTDKEATVRVVIEKTGPVGNVEWILSDIKNEIADGFETLAAVYTKFDEVKIDSDGALHCRNKPPEKEVTKE